MGKSHGQHTSGQSTSLSAASRDHVKTSATRARELASKVVAAASGSRCCVAFAHFDRASSSWKTAQVSLFGDSKLCSADLPTRGTMRSGSLFVQPTPELLTDEPEPGLWPTPTASDSRVSRRHGYMIEAHAGTTLTDAVCIHHGAVTRTVGEHTPSEVAVSPAFAEALMGFSPGWTELGSPPSATPSCPSARKSSAG